MPVVARWWKQPLLHFLLLGVMVFALHAWLTARAPVVGGAKRIEITAGQVEQLRAGYRRQFQRFPDEQELRGLITAHLREEVLYREALALGLEREDSIVRRRLAQKMEFLTGDLTQAVPPDEAQLQRFFAERAAQYARPGRVTFRQVFFSPQKRGAATEAQARAALEALTHGASEEAVGDGFLHGFEFAEQTGDDLTALFGGAFTTQLAAVSEGAWTGPLTSSYGLHVVRVIGRTPAQAVGLVTVRERVLRDFLEDQRLRANQTLVDQLQRSYVIVIDEAAVRALPSDLPATSPAVPTVPPAPVSATVQTTP